MDRTRPTIVFDWNCTLLDDIALVLEATNALLRHARKPEIDLNCFQGQFCMPLRDFYRSIGFSEAELDESFSINQDVFHDYYEARVHEQCLRPGAVELLTAATEHQINCIILSNHLEAPIRQQLTRLDIDQHFTHVLAYADRATQFKHETKGQRLARFIVEHDLPPEHCIIIGDMAEEVHIARTLGLTSVAISGGFLTVERLVAERPHHLVQGLDEFHGVLRQRGWLP